MQHCILGAKLGTNCPYEYNKNNKVYSLPFHRPVKTRLLAQSVPNWGPFWAHHGLAHVGPKWNQGTDLGGPLLGSPSGAQLPAHVGPTYGFTHEVVFWFKNYFSRTQSVIFNNIESDTLDVTSGIGQGTF